MTDINTIRTLFEEVASAMLECFQTEPDLDILLVSMHTYTPAQVYLILVSGSWRTFFKPDAESFVVMSSAGFGGFVPGCRR